jgi:hypothetical protein
MEMHILRIERKGPLMNTLEHCRIYSFSNETFQINDAYADRNNPIFNLIKEHYTFKNPITHPHLPIPLQPLPPLLPLPPLPTAFINYHIH